MPCKVIDTDEGRIIICGPGEYFYNGWSFEIHSYRGPWPLKKDGDPKERAGRLFWKMWDEFKSLSETEKETYRVG